MQSNDKYIQVGITALRTPTGDFLPSVPIYIKAPNPVNKASGLTPSEEAVLRDVASVFAAAHTDDMEVR